MKTLFVHDHQFALIDSKYYSDGKLTEKTWQRYLDYCEGLDVVSRVRNGSIAEIAGLSVSSRPEVAFFCIEKSSVTDRLYSRRVDKILRERILAADRIVCRLPSFLGSRAFWLARQLSKRTLVEVVGCPYDACAGYGSLLARMYAPIAAYQLRRIMAESKYSVYVTSKVLQERYPTAGKTVAASNVELMPHSMSANPGAQSALKIMFIGSLASKYKGLSYLQDAMEIASRQVPGLSLHVLGGGSRAVYVERYQNHNASYDLVFQDPLRGGEEVLEWLSGGDLYIQPSLQEGLPRALIEAMSVGLPCVGTTVGGIPELLAKESIVNTKSPDELAQKILTYAQSRDLMINDGARNREVSKAYLLTNIEPRRRSLYDAFFDLDA
ncbi:MAG: glycosyltransferase [Congregibacter sp.]